MDKNPVISDKPPVYKHPSEAEKTELIMVKVTPFEKEFFQTLCILYCHNLMLMEKVHKVIKDNSTIRICTYESYQ